MGLVDSLANIFGPIATKIQGIVNDITKKKGQQEVAKEEKNLDTATKEYQKQDPTLELKPDEVSSDLEKALQKALDEHEKQEANFQSVIAQNQGFTPEKINYPEDTEDLVKKYTKENGGELNADIATLRNTGFLMQGQAQNTQMLQMTGNTVTAMAQSMGTMNQAQSAFLENAPQTFQNIVDQNTENLNAVLKDFDEKERKRGKFWAAIKNGILAGPKAALFTLNAAEKLQAQVKAGKQVVGETLGTWIGAKAIFHRLADAIPLLGNVRDFILNLKTFPKTLMEWLPDKFENIKFNLSGRLLDLRCKLADMIPGGKTGDDVEQNDFTEQERTLYHAWRAMTGAKKSAKYDKKIQKSKDRIKNLQETMGITDEIAEKVGIDIDSLTSEMSFNDALAKAYNATQTDTQETLNLLYDISSNSDTYFKSVLGKEDANTIKSLSSDLIDSLEGRNLKISPQKARNNLEGFLNGCITKISQDPRLLTDKKAQAALQIISDLSTHIREKLDVSRRLTDHLDTKTYMKLMKSKGIDEKTAKKIEQKTAHSILWDQLGTEKAVLEDLEAKAQREVEIRENLTPEERALIEKQQTLGKGFKERHYENNQAELKRERALFNSLGLPDNQTGLIEQWARKVCMKYGVSYDMAMKLQDSEFPLFHFDKYTGIVKIINANWERLGVKNPGSDQLWTKDQRDDGFIHKPGTCAAFVNGEWTVFKSINQMTVSKHPLKVSEHPVRTSSVPTSSSQNVQSIPSEKVPETTEPDIAEEPDSEAYVAGREAMDDYQFDADKAEKPRIIEDIEYLNQELMAKGYPNLIPRGMSLQAMSTDELLNLRRSIISTYNKADQADYKEKRRAHQNEINDRERLAHATNLGMKFSETIGVSQTEEGDIDILVDRWHKDMENATKAGTYVPEVQPVVEEPVKPQVLNSMEKLIGLADTVFPNHGNTTNMSEKDFEKAILEKLNDAFHDKDLSAEINARKEEQATAEANFAKTKEAFNKEKQILETNKSALLPLGASEGLDANYKAYRKLHPNTSREAWEQLILNRQKDSKELDDRKNETLEELKRGMHNIDIAIRALESRQKNAQNIVNNYNKYFVQEAQTAQDILANRNS